MLLAILGSGTYVVEMGIGKVWNGWEGMGKDGRDGHGMEGDWKWEMRSGNVTYWYEGGWSWTVWMLVGLWIGRGVCAVWRDLEE